MTWVVCIGLGMGRFRVVEGLDLNQFQSMGDFDRLADLHWLLQPRFHGGQFPGKNMQSLVNLHVQTVGLHVQTVAKLQTIQRLNIHPPKLLVHCYRTGCHGTPHWVAERGPT